MFRTCATDRGRYLLRPRHAAVSGTSARSAPGLTRRSRSGHRIGPRRLAGVAELVYAPALGAGGRLPLGVRVPPPASRSGFDRGPASSPDGSPSRPGTIADLPGE